MNNILIQPKIFSIINISSFKIDFDILTGEDRILSIAGGGAIDGYDFLMVIDKTGRTREFTFDFSKTNTIIKPDSIINVVIKIIDVDHHHFEWHYSKNYAVENGLPSISNTKIFTKTDGSRLVEIEYDYESPNETDPAFVYLNISSDGGRTWNVPTTSAVGDVGELIATGPKRKIIWNPTIDLIATEKTPISAKITIVNTDGVTAVGENITGTLIIIPFETITPIVSIVQPNEKTRFAKRNGNLFKYNYNEFEPIDSSSISSESSVSSVSSSSLSSSSDSSSSSSNSIYVGVMYGQGVSKITVSDTAPLNPNIGDIWFQI